MTNEQLKTILEFEQSWRKLSADWPQELDSDFYPFNQSFDELQLPVNIWTTESVKDQPIVNELLTEIVESNNGEMLFEYYGQEVIDPFYDQSLRFKVNPVDEYGWVRIKTVLLDYLHSTDLDRKMDKLEAVCKWLFSRERDSDWLDMIDGFRNGFISIEDAGIECRSKLIDIYDDEDGKQLERLMAKERLDQISW